MQKKNDLRYVLDLAFLEKDSLMAVAETPYSEDAQASMSFALWRF